MKLDVISHCTIDTIEINDSKHVVPGGPGCYCSINRVVGSVENAFSNTIFCLVK